MPALSQEQLEKRAAIQKTATIWGAITGIVAGLLAMWILGGQGGAVRYGGAIVVAVAVGFAVFRASFQAGSKSAQCEKCGAAFSRSRTGHVETLLNTETKIERVDQEDKSTKVTTWTEEMFEVTDSYTCSKCQDVTTKTYETKRKSDEKTEVLPFVPPKQAAESAKGGAGPKSGTAKPDGDSSQKGHD